MKHLWLALFVAALVAPACESAETDRLREQLEAARSQVTAAGNAVLEAETLRRELEGARSQLEQARDALRKSNSRRRSLLQQLVQVRDQLFRFQQSKDDLVVSVPKVGRLYFTCNDDREFSFTFTPEGATVTVEQSIGGEITTRQLHPGQELTSPFGPAKLDREWTATYRHKPATITATISVSPAVRDGICFVSNSALERSFSPN